MTVINVLNSGTKNLTNFFFRYSLLYANIEMEQSKNRERKSHE